MFVSTIELRNSRFLDVVVSTCLGATGVAFDVPYLLTLDLANNDVRAYIRALARVAAIRDEIAYREVRGERVPRHMRGALRRHLKDAAFARRTAGLPRTAPVDLPIYDPLAERDALAGLAKCEPGPLAAVAHAG